MKSFETRRERLLRRHTESGESLHPECQLAREVQVEAQLDGRTFLERALWRLTMRITRLQLHRHLTQRRLERHRYPPVGIGSPELA